VKGFVILLLGVIFVALITSSLPSSAVDDLGGNNVISEDADKLNIVPTKSPEYKIYLHVIVRDAQGQLVSVSETMNGSYFEHEITDYAFDHGLVLVSSYDVKSDTIILPTSDKKEIIIIDNMKYEKVQYREKYSLDLPLDVWNEDRDQLLVPKITKFMIFIPAILEVSYGSETKMVDVYIFQAFIPLVYLAEGDEVNTQWTIFRTLN